MSWRATMRRLHQLLRIRERQAVGGIARPRLLDDYRIKSHAHFTPAFLSIALRVPMASPSRVCDLKLQVFGKGQPTGETRLYRVHAASSRVFPGARPGPVLHAAAQSGFHWIVFDVPGDASLVVPVASPSGCATRKCRFSEKVGQQEKPERVGYTRLQAAFFLALDQGQSCTLRHSPAFTGLFSMYRVTRPSWSRSRILRSK
jgi:hypothetical protein